MTNRPGINLRWNKKKINAGIGTSVAFNNFEQKNITTGLDRKYNFVNFFPTANFTLKMKKNQNIRFNYNGSSNAPSLNQLQPVTDNTDVLNKYVGNPDLKQSFRHTASVSYNFYNVLKERNLWTNLWAGYTQNAFISESTIDLDSAKTVYRTVNADGVYNVNFFSSYGVKLKKLGIRLWGGVEINQNRNITILITHKAGLADVKNNSVNDNGKYAINIGSNKEKENKYEFNLWSSFGITKAKNSVNSTANANYKWVNLNSSGNVTFLKKFNFRTDVKYETREADPRFPANNTYTLWNAGLTRKLYKDQFEIGVSVNDILKQNRGYDRTFNDYRYTETYYNTLTRFWMLTFKWDFNKNHAKTTDDF
jgi:hypothetical protein